MGFFFKQRGHYVFDYKPMYYDPRKEDREKREKRIKKELGIVDAEKTPENYKASFDFRRNSITRARRDKSSTLRLLIILFLLIIIAYIFLFTDVFLQFSNLIK